MYDLCHVGHARTFSAFDTIVKYLRFIGYDVNYVRNITDIDDKIIKRSLENNEHYSQLTERMIQEMQADFGKLNIANPDVEPRVSDHIETIINMCKELESKGFAYVNSDGDLLFRVKAYEQYGSLSKQNLDQLMAGARTEISSNKESSLDFVLWKSAKPGEPHWESPWGCGRPGWHIECSAMSDAELGSNFDIHGGGSDLMFPHHENEIAQSCCATGDKFANYWLHTGMVMVDKEKMSKSLNNFFTIRTLLETYDSEAVRFFLVSNQYRSNLNYSTENLEIANKGLERFYTALKGACDTVDYAKPYTQAEFEAKFGENEYLQRFVTAMADDFNTAEAVAVMFDLVKVINTSDNQAEKQNHALLLRILGNILGILHKSTQDYFNSVASDEVDVVYIEELIAKRKEARANKDWTTADFVRDELNRLNIILEDGVNGTTWKVNKHEKK